MIGLDCCLPSPLQVSEYCPEATGMEELTQRDKNRKIFRPDLPRECFTFKFATPILPSFFFSKAVWKGIMCNRYLHFSISEVQCVLIRHPGAFGKCSHCICRWNLPCSPFLDKRAGYSALRSSSPLADDASLKSRLSACVGLCFLFCFFFFPPPSWCTLLNLNN